MNSLIEALNHWGEHYLSFAWSMLWQSNVLIAVLFALDFALRRKVRAAVRYALWLVVLFKLFLPPSLALPTSLAWWIRPVAVAAAPATRPAPAFKVTYGEPALSPAPPLAQAAIAFTPPPSRLTSHALALFGAAIVSLGLLGWMLLRWCQVGRTVRQATPASDALAHLLDEAKLLAGLRREVHLRLTDTPMSPAVCGLFRPVVLLPRSLVTRLAPEQLRAVLLHELIHLRRGDVWVNCAQTLLQIGYWWHPLLWLANARIRRVREEAVDDAVMLALADERDAYAPTLLEVARLAFHRPSASLGLVGILESRSALRQRIERLVNFQAPRKAGLSVLSVLGVAALAALAAPMGAGKNPSRFGQSALPLHIFQIDRIAFATNLAARAGLPSINLNSGVSITSPSQPGANRLPLLPGQSTRPEDPDLAQKALLQILAAEGLKVEPSEVHLSMVGGSVLVCTGPDKLDSVTRVLTQLNSGPLTDSFSAIRTPPARLQAPASTEATVSRANENEAARKSSSEAVVHKTFVIQIRDDGTYWEQTNQLDFSKVANRLLALSPSNSSVQIICWPKAPVSAFKPIDSIVRGLGITPIFEVLSKPEIPTPETLYLHVIKVDSSFVWQTLINDGSNHAGSSSSDTKAVVRDRANANVRRFFLSRGLDLATSPKSIVLDEYSHALIVRATLDDFSFVEKILQELNKIERIGSPEKPTSEPIAIAGAISAPVSTNQVGLSPARQALLRKLNTIRLDEVHFQRASLSDVVRELVIQSKQRDPDKEGISFIITQPIGGTLVSLNFRNVRLATVLDAIVKGADRPIMYSLEDYAVAFRGDIIQQQLPLYTRFFKVDTNTFDRVLEKSAGGGFGNGSFEAVAGFRSTTNGQPVSAKAREFFTTLGLDITFPKAVFFSDTVGLMVHATEEDLWVIEKSLQTLTAAPPQIRIEAKFVDLKTEDAKALGFTWRNLISSTTNSLGSRPRDSSSVPGSPSLTGILTDPQFRVGIQALEKRAGTDILSAPAVTTLSHRVARIEVTAPTNIVVQGQTQTIQLGPSVEVLAEVLPDNSVIELTVSAVVVEFFGYHDPGPGEDRTMLRFRDGDWVEEPGPTTGPIPIIRVRKLKDTARLWDGQTLVLGHPVGVNDNPAEPPGYKQLVLFVKPTIIDPAGNPIHTDADLPARTNSIPAQNTAPPR